MQAVSLPALSGWRWVRDGWILFRKQPMAFFSWAMFVSLILMVASVTPPIGPLFFVVLMPTATLLSLNVARHAEQGQKVLLGTWIAPLRLAGVFDVCSGWARCMFCSVCFLGSLRSCPSLRKSRKRSRLSQPATTCYPCLKRFALPWRYLRCCIS